MLQAPPPASMYLFASTTGPLFYWSQAPSRATKVVTQAPAPLKAMGSVKSWEGANQIQLVANGESLSGKSPQLKGLKVSSLISALPALVYTWRKPHLGSLPQKRNSNKTRKVPPLLLSPATNREVRDGIVVRLQHLGVFEDVIPKCVEPVQGDEQVSDSHPLLQKTWGRCFGLNHQLPNRDASHSSSYKDAGYHRH